MARTALLRLEALLTGSHDLKLSAIEIERSVFWDSVALNAMAQWRKVHIPIFMVFAVLAIGHIFSVFIFWEWR